MPRPGAPPKVLPTRANVLPSPDTLTRYQLSTFAVGLVGEAGSTISWKLVPLLVERNTWPSCETATITVPSLELSTARHDRFCVVPADTGSVGAVHVVPPLLLSTRRPPWITATRCCPSADMVTDSKLMAPL